MKPRSRLGHRLLAGATIVIVVAWLTSAAAVVIWGSRDGARTSDAIVVLGAAQYVGRPSPVLRARLDHALSLWQRGLAPVLIFTGGTGAGAVARCRRHRPAGAGRRLSAPASVSPPSGLVKREKSGGSNAKPHVTQVKKTLTTPLDKLPSFDSNRK